MNLSIYQYLSFTRTQKDPEILREEIVIDLKNKTPWLEHEEFELISSFCQIPKDYSDLSKFEDKIQGISEKVVHQCNQIIPQEELHIFMLPSYDQFIIDEMNGCSGFAPETGKIIIISLNTEGENWQMALTQGLAHEYHHTTIHHKRDWITLGDTLIYEGLAESFREDIVGGPITPYIERNSKETCLKFWKKLRNQVDDPSYELYQDVFFGSDTYPQWLGYSLGYHLIQSLRATSNYTWGELTSTSAEKLMREILTKNTF